VAYLHVNLYVVFLFVPDEIDIVTEQVSDYKKEEDPRFFRSTKTGRGPLSDDWLRTMKNTPPEARDTVMCAYKMCKVGLTSSRSVLANVGECDVRREGDVGRGATRCTEWRSALELSWLFI